MGFAAIHRHLAGAAGPVPAAWMKGEIIDVGNGGCRLRVPMISRIRVGEAVGLNWLDQQERIGRIVWLTQDSDGIAECGIQWVVCNPQAVEVMFDNRQSLPAIRGDSPPSEGRGGEAVLLYARPLGSYRASAWVKNNDEWQRVSLAVQHRTGIIEAARVTFAKGTTEHCGVEAEVSVWQLLAPYSGSAAVAPASR